MSDEKFISGKHVRISVVIPTYDRPAYLVEAVESALKQTLLPYEVIIADNGSERHGLRFSSELVKTVELKPKVGASAARNAGACAATGEYLAFLDDDDWWEPQFLEYALKRAAETGKSIVYGRKDIWKNGVQSRYKTPRESDFTIEKLLVRNPGTGGQNLFIKRSVFVDLGGFDRSLSAGEDVAFALDALISGYEVACCPRAVSVLRTHDGERLRDDYLRRISFVIKYRGYMSSYSLIKRVGRMLAHGVRYRIDLLLRRLH